MDDPVQNFVSQQNLFNLAQGLPNPSESASDASIGMDAYMPPVPPNNVVNLPQLANRRYIVSAIEPHAVQASDAMASMAKILTGILKEKESSGNYQVVNKERPGNTASGAYQYTDSTWNNYGGYPKAALAPPEVQDRRFAEDITHRLLAFGGDPYKAIAAHYLPALADNPSLWNKPFKVRGRVVKPVSAYLRYVVQGTPLEKGLDEYLAQQQ